MNRLASGGLRMAAGPLAIAGFFLPWFEGRGPLSGRRYDGYDLLQFGAWLHGADLSPAADLLLEAARLLAVGIVVSGLWLTLLGPRRRGHPLRTAAGAYLVGAATVLWTASAAWHGSLLPLPGTGLVAAGAAVFLASAASHRPYSAAFGGSAGWSRAARASISRARSSIGGLWSPARTSR